MTNERLNEILQYLISKGMEDPGLEWGACVVTKTGGELGTALGWVLKGRATKQPTVLWHNQAGFIIQGAALTWWLGKKDAHIETEGNHNSDVRFTAYIVDGPANLRGGYEYLAYGSGATLLEAIYDVAKKMPQEAKDQNDQLREQLVKARECVHNEFCPVGMPNDMSEGRHHCDDCKEITKLLGDGYDKDNPPNTSPI